MRKKKQFIMTEAFCLLDYNSSKLNNFSYVSPDNTCGVRGVDNKGERVSVRKGLK